MPRYITSLLGSLLVLLIFQTLLQVAEIKHTFSLGIGLGVIVGCIQRDIERWLKP